MLLAKLPENASSFTGGLGGCVFLLMRPAADSTGLSKTIQWNGKPRRLRQFCILAFVLLRDALICPIPVGR